MASAPAFTPRSSTTSTAVGTSVEISTATAPDAVAQAACSSLREMAARAREVRRDVEELESLAEELRKTLDEAKMANAGSEHGACDLHALIGAIWEAHDVLARVARLGEFGSFWRSASITKDLSLSRDLVTEAIRNLAHEWELSALHALAARLENWQPGIRGDQKRSNNAHLTLHDPAARYTQMLQEYWRLTGKSPARADVTALQQEMVVALNPPGHHEKACYTEESQEAFSLLEAMTERQKVLPGKERPSVTELVRDNSFKPEEVGFESDADMVHQCAASPSTPFVPDGEIADNPVVIELANRDQLDQQQIGSLLRLQHPNVAPTVGVASSSSSSRKSTECVGIMRRKLGGETLASELGKPGKPPRMRWWTRMRVAIQLAYAMHFLHGRLGFGLPGTFQPGRVACGRDGLWAKVMPRIAGCDFGARLYVPPEGEGIEASGQKRSRWQNWFFGSHQQTDSNAEASFKRDVYAFGVLLQALIQGHEPKETNVGHLAAGDESEDLSAVVAECCALDPASRPTASAVLARLRSSLEKRRTVSHKQRSHKHWAIEPVEALPPEDACCPLSLMPMEDPVKAENRETVDRESLRVWFHHNGPRDFFTGKRFRISNFCAVPNFIARERCRGWLQSRGALVMPSMEALNVRQRRDRRSLASPKLCRDLAERLAWKAERREPIELRLQVDVDKKGKSRNGNRNEARLTLAEVVDRIAEAGDFATPFHIRSPNAPLGDVGVASLAAAMKGSACVKSLSLGPGTKLGKRGARALGSAVLMSFSLQELALTHIGKGDAACSDLMKALGMNTTLLKLSFVRTSMKREGAKAIANAFKGPDCSIRSLKISDSTIGEAGVNALIAALRWNASLQDFSLVGCGMGDRSAEELAKALKETPASISSLDVSQNNIGGPGTHALADALPEMPSLTSLNLDGNNAADEGIRALADVMAKGKRVQELMLGENGVTESGARSLIRSFSSNVDMAPVRLSLAGNSGIPASLRHELDRALHGRVRFE